MEEIRNSKNIKKVLIDLFIFVTLFFFVGTIADEFYKIRNSENQIIFTITTTILVVFIWKNVVRKYLDRLS